MDKFKIGHLVDYFLKVNNQGTSFKDLSQEDMLSLAILSIFDKGGKTVKVSSYSYERPNDVIDENEFNLTKKEYEKAAKQIQKAIKKKVGKEFTALNIPSYEDLQAMMKDDKKIDFDELHFYAREGSVKNTNAQKPKFHGLPQKAQENLTLQEKQDFVSEVANDDTKYAIIEKFENMSDAEYRKYVDLAKEYDIALTNLQTHIDKFEPDKNVAYNRQDGLNGIQFNDKGQKVFRINGDAGVYESYKYENSNDTRFSEMMRYNADGYKTEYWQKSTYVDPNNPKEEHVGYIVYSLDENEKITKISTVPENFSQNQEFNDFKFYQQYCRYYDELDKNGAFDDNITTEASAPQVKETKVKIDPSTIK